MKLYKTEKQRWLAGLLLIALIYSLYFIYVVDGPLHRLPTRPRHLLNFSTAIAVYVIGTLHLGKMSAAWMRYLWHWIHFVLLGTVCAVGFYEWLFGALGEGSFWVGVTSSFFEFLISPAFFTGMGLIDQAMKRTQRNHAPK